MNIVSNGQSIEFFETSTKYSTNETIIGKWVDGRPIYRVSGTGISPNKVKTNGILHPPIENAEIIGINVSITNKNNINNILPAFTEEGVMAAYRHYNIANGLYVYIISTSLLNLTVYWSLEYLKTTDVIIPEQESI